MESLFGAAVLVHIAGILSLSGYLSRDQLVLRLLLFCGGCLYIAYYFLSAATPLWDAIFWSSLFLTANLFVMVGHSVTRQQGVVPGGRCDKVDPDWII